MKILLLFDKLFSCLDIKSLFQIEPAEKAIDNLNYNVLKDSIYEIHNYTPAPC